MNKAKLYDEFGLADVEERRVQPPSSLASPSMPAMGAQQAVSAVQHWLGSGVGEGRMGFGL